MNLPRASSVKHCSRGYLYTHAAGVSSLIVRFYQVKSWQVTLIGTDFLRIGLTWYRRFVLELIESILSPHDGIILENCTLFGRASRYFCGWGSRELIKAD